MYFNADEETQQLYRAWAQAIAKGFATIKDPPEILKDALVERGLWRPERTNKGKP